MPGLKRRIVERRENIYRYADTIGKTNAFDHPQDGSLPAFSNYLTLCHSSLDRPGKTSHTPYPSMD
jgi:hypothetical protein